MIVRPVARAAAISSAAPGVGSADLTAASSSSVSMRSSPEPPAARSSWSLMMSKRIIGVVVHGNAKDCADLRPQLAGRLPGWHARVDGADGVVKVRGGAANAHRAGSIVGGRSGLVALCA